MQAQSNLKDCACRNLRMTSRVITQYYDKALRPAGLHAAQFALLAGISSLGERTVGELADAFLMDQTTVTRNIEVLKKNGLIDVKIGDQDTRKRKVIITEIGSKKLEEALPLWDKAQRHIEEGIGSAKYETFLNILADIQRVI